MQRQEHKQHRWHSKLGDAQQRTRQGPSCRRARLPTHRALPGARVQLAAPQADQPATVQRSPRGTAAASTWSGRCCAAARAPPALRAPVQGARGENGRGPGHECSSLSCHHAERRSGGQQEPPKSGHKDAAPHTWRDSRTRAGPHWKRHRTGGEQRQRQAQHRAPVHPPARRTLSAPSLPCGGVDWRPLWAQLWL